MPEERLKIVRLNTLQFCDFVVDVGANSGQWMSNLRENGYKGPALCVEPSKKIFKELIQNLDHTNTQFVNIAIGNFNGFANLNVASNQGISSSLLEMDVFHKKGNPNIKITHKEKVSVCKLAKILDAIDAKSLYLKIDTQGYELEVLKSIKQINFKKIKGIELELNLVSSYKGAKMMEEVISYLRKNRFHPIRFENGFGLNGIGQILQMDGIFIKE
jgi:FkbM family methyltransferase